MEEKVKNMFSSYFDMSKTCAAAVVKRIEANEREPCLKELDTAVCDVAKIEQMTRKESQILNKFEADIGQSADLEWASFSEMLDQELAKHAPKDADKCKSVVDYRSHVESLIDSSELTDMIVMSSENNIDPISRKPIEHPVRIKFCNHVIEKASVTEMFAATKKNKLRCPHMGCDKWFTAKDLKDDSKEEEEESDEETC